MKRKILKRNWYIFSSSMRDKKKERVKIITITLFVFCFLSCATGEKKESLGSNSSNWSLNQGAMNWYHAKTKCTSIGGRLPTVEELLAAYKSGIGKDWLKDGKYYWSSEESSKNLAEINNNSAFFVMMENGTTIDETKDSSIFLVRCIEIKSQNSESKNIEKNIIWSEYQGSMNWENARKKCFSIGMRLPSRSELIAVYNSKKKEEWLKDGIIYWTSEEFSSERAYYFFMNIGNATEIEKVLDKIHIRCVNNINSINTSLVNKIKIMPPTFKAHKDQITNISVGEKYIATSSYDGSVKLWDRKKLTFVRTLENKNPVNGIAFSPSEKFLLSADTKLRIWNLGKRTLDHTFDLQTDLVHQVKFRSEDAFVAIEMRPISNSVIQLVCSEWSIKTGKKSELDMGTDLSTFAISPDTSKVAVAYRTGVIKLFSLSDKKTIREFIGHTGLINFISFLPDGKLLSSARDNTVRIWDIENSNEPIIMQEQFVPVYGFVTEEFGTYLAISLDGKLLAGISGYLDGVSLTVERIKIFSQGKVFLSQWENKYNHLANAIAFDKDSTNLIVAYSDGTMHRFSLNEIMEISPENTKSIQKETILNWSEYQGEMFWNDALSKCASIGMRLPTIEELKMLYGSKLIRNWQKVGSNYWSSTLSNNKTPNYFDVSNGNSSDIVWRVAEPKHVRCVY